MVGRYAGRAGGAAVSTVQGRETGEREKSMVIHNLNYVIKYVSFDAHIRLYYILSAGYLAGPT